MSSYYERNKERINKNSREYYQKNLEENRRKRREYNQRNRDKMIQVAKDWRVANREKALKHYSGGDIKCKCCGEGTLEFLCIDHIDGGGNKHRKSLKKGENGGGDMYRWLIKNDFPSGFQVLCHNCNLAKGFYGLCPHMNDTR